MSGAEAGYRAVRTADLAERLLALGYNVQDCGPQDVPHDADPGPEERNAHYLEAIAATCEELAQWVEDAHQRGEIPLVLGGDHSIAAGTVAGTAAHFRAAGSNVGVIWIDAHGDMNTPETSPSGNVHGMPLAATLGLGARELTHLRGYSPKVRPQNVVIIGIRDIDLAEAELIRQSGISTFTMREIDERGMFSVVNEAIERASDGTVGFHVSFDMDSLDPSIAPGVGTPVPGGLTYREAHLALEMIADTRRMVSMDVVEVNPMLDSHNITAKMAVGLIGSALGKRILPWPESRRQPSAAGFRP
jgi:arginase